MNIYDYLIFFMISFIIMTKINYMKSNDYKQKLIFYCNKHYIHIHHYLIFIFLIMFMLYSRFINKEMLYITIVLFLGCIAESFLFGFESMFKIKEDYLDLI